MVVFLWAQWDQKEEFEAKKSLTFLFHSPFSPPLPPFSPPSSSFLPTPLSHTLSLFPFLSPTFSPSFFSLLSCLFPSASFLCLFPSVSVFLSLLLCISPLSLLSVSSSLSVPFGLCQPLSLVFISYHVSPLYLFPSVRLFPFILVCLSCPTRTSSENRLSGLS